MASPGFQLPANLTYSNNDIEKGFGNIAKRTFDIGEASRKPTPPASGVPRGTSNIPTFTGGPTSLKDLPITTKFGGSTRIEQRHEALDLAAPTGTPISSLSGGIVSNVVRGKKQGDPNFGNFAIITDPEGRQFRYSHLNESYVEVGQKIKRGEILGTIGRSGNVYSQFEGGDPSHLDIRIRDMAKKVFLDPELFL